MKRGLTHGPAVLPAASWHGNRAGTFRCEPCPKNWALGSQRPCGGTRDTGPQSPFGPSAGLAVPFGVIFGGTDLNEDVNQEDKRRVMGRVLEEAR